MSLPSELWLKVCAEIFRDPSPALLPEDVRPAIATLLKLRLVSKYFSRLAAAYVFRRYCAKADHLDRLHHARLHEWDDPCAQHIKACVESMEVHLNVLFPKAEASKALATGAQFENLLQQMPALRELGLFLSAVSPEHGRTSQTIPRPTPKAREIVFGLLKKRIGCNGLEVLKLDWLPVFKDRVAELREVRGTLQGLRTLHLDVKYIGYVASRLMDIKALLAELTSLRTLRLDYARFLPDPGDLLKSVSSNSLQNLCISHSVLHAVDLSALLCQNRGELRHIIFHNIYLASGTWDTIFHIVHDAPKLKLLELSDLRYCQSSRPISFGFVPESDTEGLRREAQWIVNLEYKAAISIKLSRWVFEPIREEQVQDASFDASHDTGKTSTMCLEKHMLRDARDRQRQPEL